MNDITIKVDYFNDTESSIDIGECMAKNRALSINKICGITLHKFILCTSHRCNMPTTVTGLIIIGNNSEYEFQLVIGAKSGYTYILSKGESKCTVSDSFISLKELKFYTRDLVGNRYKLTVDPDEGISCEMTFHTSV